MEAKPRRSVAQCISWGIGCRAAQEVALEVVRGCTCEATEQQNAKKQPAFLTIQGLGTPGDYRNRDQLVQSDARWQLRCTNSTAEQKLLCNLLSKPSVVLKRPPFWTAKLGHGSVQQSTLVESNLEVNTTGTIKRGGVVLQKRG